jgi:hypothetical protein
MPHDFGQGIYCFKGDIHRALSFAMDRSWPWFEDKEDGTSACVGKDNPAIVLFLDPVDSSDIFQVDTTPMTDEYLRQFMSADLIRKLRMKQEGWIRDGDWNYWKLFVKAARYYKSVPEKPRVFHGALHDCNDTNATDQCKEPKLDTDFWKQFCFEFRHDLGSNFLFIEFKMDRDSFLGEEENITEVRAQEVHAQVDHTIFMGKGDKGASNKLTN